MSLRLRLLLAIGVSVTVLWGAAALWMLRDLDRGLQRTLDERLAMSARMVAGLISQSGAGGDGEPRISAIGALTIPGGRGMACQVRSLRGEIIATTRVPGREPIIASPGYRTLVLDGQSWRTHTLRAGGFDITTADRLDERELLRRRIAMAAGVPFLVAVLGGLLALWLGAGRALAPLGDLRRTLESRAHDAIEPLDGSRLPSELQPLIHTLNRLLARVGEALQRERNFTSDAAHELRTPLTVVDTHLQVARLSATGEAREALTDAATGVSRLRATLEQLLLLARVEGHVPFHVGTPVAAADLVASAIAAVGREGAGRIAVDPGEAGPTLLAVPTELAVVALRNLLENALRYSAPGSQVGVALRHADGRVAFVVTDQGPGMSLEEAKAATRRFWRGRTSAGGSGLGLALVDAIARRFGGSLELHPLQARGLGVHLVLPSLAGRTAAPRR